MSANTMPITMLNGFGCDCQQLKALGCPDCGGTCVSGLGDVYDVIGHSLRHDTKYVPLYREPGGAPVHYIKPTYFIGTIAGFNSKKNWLKLKDGRWVYIGNFFNEFRVGQKPITQAEESTLSAMVRNTFGAVIPAGQASAAVIASASDIAADKAIDFALSVGNVLKWAVPVLLVAAGYVVYKKVSS